eukprot:327170-Amphidinium_carterae.1
MLLGGFSNLFENVQNNFNETMFAEFGGLQQALVRFPFRSGALAEPGSLRRHRFDPWDNHLAEDSKRLQAGEEHPGDCYDHEAGSRCLVHIL